MDECKGVKEEKIMPTYAWVAEWNYLIILDPLQIGTLIHFVMTSKTFCCRNMETVNKSLVSKYFFNLKDVKIFKTKGTTHVPLIKNVNIT